MKKTLLFSAALILCTVLMAQAPQGISHQAVIRNTQGELVTGQTIGIRVSILQGSAQGIAVLVETHEPESNENGLITYVIGNGTNVSGSFEEIDWADGPYFLKTEADLAGGTDYSITGITQFLSVPYALIAEKVAGSISSNILPPKVIALEATEITSHSAIFNGIVNAEGFLTEVVFEWGETTEYGNTVTAIQSPVKGSDDIHVSAELIDLQSGKNYHYRIIASNAVDISFSDDMYFETGFTAPLLTTIEPYSIFAYSAKSGGQGISDGGFPITDYGLVWSSSQNPTIENNEGITNSECSGDYSEFFCDLMPLTHNTQYYVRSYATNTFGTGYGEEWAFITPAEPMVTTFEVTNITSITAISGGTVNETGNDQILQWGLVWSTLENPCVENNEGFTNEEVLVGEDTFYSSLTGLTPETTYYLRAYIYQDLYGYTYGNQLSFQTTTPFFSEVIYVGNENTSGTPPIDPNQYEEGAQVTVLGNTGNLVKSDFAFAGWNTETSGSGTYYFPYDTYIMGTENATLYAIYNLIKNGYMAEWSGGIPLHWNSLGPLEGISQVEGYIGNWAVRLFDNTVTSVTGIEQTVYSEGTLPAEFIGQTVTLSLYSKWNGLPSSLGQVCIIDGSNSSCYQLSNNSSWLKNDLTHLISESANQLKVKITATGDEFAQTGSHDIDGVVLLLGDCVTETTVPLVSSLSPSLSSPISAIVGGNVLADGGAEVTERGIYWGIDPDPQNTGSLIQLGAGVGEFTIELGELNPNTTYHFVAYAANNQGSAFGQKEQFVTDDADIENAFVTTWDTSLSHGTTVNLALAGTVNATIYWGDGTITTVETSGPHTHDYGVDGIYTVSVLGNVTAYNSNSGAAKLISVDNWGQVGFTSMAGAFASSINLVSVPANSNGLEGVNDMSGMFSGATAFNHDISGWDVSGVTDMSQMFYYATIFSQPIGSWDVSGVTDMSQMFYHAVSFEQSLGDWNTSNVTNMQGMFEEAILAGAGIGNWDVSNVTDMSRMFFNKFHWDLSPTPNLSNWNTSSVTDMSYMFFFEVQHGPVGGFFGNLSNWDVSNVNTMEGMFHGQMFISNISNWDVSSVTTMGGMFSYAGAIDVDISGWNVSNVTDMGGMFMGVQSFNINIGLWDVSNVTTMASMFEGALSFNQDIGGWNVSSVTDMSGMFSGWFYEGYGDMAFNQDISGWDVSSVSSMHAMFRHSTSFNQDLSSWCVEQFTFAPTDFDTDATSWVLPRPIWGTCPTPPSVSTTAVTGITNNSATTGGNVTDDGGLAVTARGVVWSTGPEPTIESNEGMTSDGDGLGEFTSYLTGLNSGTTYYVRSYATNIVITAYGNEEIFSTSLQVGDSYGGGIVAYIFEPGDPGFVEGEIHGLVAALYDIGPASWGCHGTLIGGTSTDIGSGSTNTSTIVSGCSEPGIAPLMCLDFELNGYDDWFLPSRDELNMLYMNQFAIGGFVLGTYWSSSEANENSAWCRDFAFGDSYGGNKNNENYIRPVRVF